MMYKISDLAKILGLTSNAIRFLENENLIPYVARDESGRRHYRIADIFRFLSYTKYRSMGFPMKTLVKQFSGIENDRSLISKRLEEQKTKAQEKAAYYTELAAAIEEHIEGAKRIETLLDQYEFAKSPDILVLYDAEYGWIPKNREVRDMAQKWVKTMPMTRLVVMLHDTDANAANFGYAISPKQAQQFSLPTDSFAQEIPSVSCLHTVVATSEALAETPHIIFEKPIEYAKSHGFEICGKPWGYILLAEAAPEERLTPYVELWIPIK